KANLYLYIPDATGVASGSPVRVEGINVGKVESVGLSGSTNPDRIVKITMSIERKSLSSITADSTAQIASDTAIADKYVAISAGTSPGHIPADGEVPLKREEELLKTGDIEQFQKQINALDAVIADIEQGKNRVGEFVQGDEMYRSLLQRIVEIERAVQAVADTSDA